MKISKFEKCEKFAKLKKLIARLDNGADLVFTNKTYNTMHTITTYDELLGIAGMIDDGDIILASELPTYKIGDKFYYDSGYPDIDIAGDYMLALIDVDDNNGDKQFLVSLINLRNANRYSSPVYIKNTSAITIEDFDLIAGWDGKKFRKV